MPPAALARFETAIQAFEAEDQAKAPPQEVTLWKEIVGSLLK
ncbi:MAG: hypothetical protein ACKVY0_09325 [Prosthecobacter sp.]